MKKYLAAIAAIMAVFLTFAATSCGKDKTESKDSVSSVTPLEGVEVKAKKTEANVALEDVESFSYETLFEIYANGVKRAVKSEYIDKSAVKKQLGKYVVTCSFGGETASIIINVVAERDVFVQALTTKITVKDSEILKYDYTKHFSVSVNGNEAEVKPEYLNLSALKPDPGTYVITCSYSGSSVKLWVEVTETPYVATALETDVYVYVGCAEELNLTALFGVTLDNEEVEVTDDMITGEVSPVVGDYEINLLIGSRRAKTVVHVVDRHIIKIGAAYGEIDLSPDELTSYDFLSDFYVYEDGKRVDVKSSGVTLDKSALAGATLGDSCEVKLAYASPDGKGSEIKAIKVNVREEGSVRIKVKNAEVFDGGTINPVELFEITKNGKKIEVTPDMLSGEIDFSTGDTCEITLRYENHVKVATVKKITGVLIRYAHGDVVSIKKGTDINKYDFASDFEVYINGVRFYGIQAYADISAVDFNTAGTYEVTLNILYNDVNVGRGAPKFAAAKSAKITYKVVPRVYELGYVDDVVELGSEVKNYNVLDNIVLYADGYKQSFTRNKGSVNSLTTYYEIKNDFDPLALGEQTVAVELYVYGADAEPITAEFIIVVKNGISVYADSISMYTGEELFVPDLFRVYDGGKTVKVTLDMVSGRIDTTIPGVYELSVKYKGVVRYAEVSVIPAEYVGDYETFDKTIATEAVEGEDGDIAEEAKPSVSIGDMIVGKTAGKNIGMNVHEIAATDVEYCDYGFDFMLGTNRHKAVFIDGVVVLIPYNELRMAYTDAKRPLVYFKKGVWNVTDVIEAHSSSDGKTVYSNAYSGISSIYLYKAKNVESGETKWFAIRIKLDAYVNHDYYYSVGYGFTEIPAGITAKSVGEKIDVPLGDDNYKILVIANGIGRIDRNASENPFENTVFNGSVDGCSATLSIGTGNVSSLTSANGTLFSFNPSNAYGMKYASSSAKDNTFTIYGIKVETLNKKYNTKTVEYRISLDVKEKDNAEEKITVTPFSYKFKLDTENGTFAVVEKDEYFGMYKCADGRFIFLDGFGRGVIDVSGERTGHYGFAYTVSGRQMTLGYYDSAKQLSKTKGVVSVDNFGNILTAEDLGDEFKKGTLFENVNITKGAIVTMSRTIFHKGESKDAVYAAVRIVTKDGEYTDAQKKGTIGSVPIVDTDKVARNLSVPGFYYVAVNLKNEKGAIVTKLFAIQVLDETFESGKGFARNYGNSLSGLSSFSMNSFGEVTFVYDGVTYTGLAHTDETGSKLYVTVNAAGYNDIVLTCKIDSDGILSVYGVNGGLIITEHYCAGTVKYAGNGSLIIRSFATSGGNVFYVSSALSVIGNKVQLTTVSGETVKDLSVGALLKFTLDGKEYIFKIASLGDEKNGLIVSDALGGTYADIGGGTQTLVIDGFGNATLDSSAWTYTIYDQSENDARLILTNAAGSFKRIRVGLGGGNAGKFQDLGDIVADDFSGKTYVAEVATSWGEDDEGGTYRYTLVFGSNGTASIGYTYTGIDLEDRPPYIGSGTYSVSGKTVTVVINGCTITMECTDLWSLNRLRIKSISTSASISEVGNLAEGKNFKLN
ncbi:MAG: hypothetical protein PUI31_05550 [Clostridia bacterium]|nr:hypothetical protein [Clostridia bacterium]